MSAYILGSSVENFATTSRDRIFGTVAIFVFSIRLPKDIAGLEFLAIVGGRGYMNAIHLNAERNSNSCASVSLKMSTVVGPVYRKPAIHLTRTATTSK